MKKIVRKEYILTQGSQIQDDLIVIAQKIILDESIDTKGYHLWLFCEVLQVRRSGISLISSSPNYNDVNDRHGKSGSNAEGWGNHGGNGEDGKIGAHAGNIKIWAEEITGVKFTMRAYGADGGNGGDAGNGKKGQDMNNHRPLGQCFYTRNCSTLYRGQSGGNSGIPGKGSDGSDGGNLFIRTLKQGPIDYGDLFNSGGKVGNNGNNGKAGGGGLGYPYFVYGSPGQIEN